MIDGYKKRNGYLCRPEFVSYENIFERQFGNDNFK